MGALVSLLGPTSDQAGSQNGDAISNVEEQANAPPETAREDGRCANRADVQHILYAKPATLLATGKPLPVKSADGKLVIDVPVAAPDAADSVIALQIEGEPVTVP